MIVLVNGHFLTNLEGEEVDVLHAEELGLTDHPIVGRKAIEMYIRESVKKSTPWYGEQELEAEVQRVLNKFLPLVVRDTCINVSVGVSASAAPLDESPTSPETT